MSVLISREITEEMVKEYCQKRGLVLITRELFKEMKTRWSSAERVGKWIGSDDYDEYYRCSECRKGETQFGRLYRYCPWCGAIMEGEEDE